MTVPVFGEKEAKKGLPKLGFQIDETRGKGGHALASHPTRKPNPPRERPFVTIPSWKEYGDPNFRKKFIKEIEAFGFSEEQVIRALKGRK